MNPYGFGVETSSHACANQFLYWTVICASILVAMLLSIIQLPALLEWGRPAWLLLVLVYWAIVLPDRVGVATAWVAGLCQDVLHGNVLGQNALAFCVVVFLAFLLRLRIRVFPLWQQMLTLFILSGIYQLIVRVVQGSVGDVAETLVYWLPTLSSAILWPMVVWILFGVGRKYRML